VEVYFPTYGWIEFEATPAAATPAANTAGTDDINLSSSASNELPYWMLDDQYAASGAGIDGIPSAVSPKLPWPYIYSLGFICLLALGVYVTRESLNRWVSRLEQVRTAHDAYDRMCYLADRGNAGRFEHETPAEFGRRLAGNMPGLAEPIDDITSAYVAARYGRQETLDGSEMIVLQKAWVWLCPNLVKNMTRQSRWSVIRLFWSPR